MFPKLFLSAETLQFQKAPLEPKSSSGTHPASYPLGGGVSFPRVSDWTVQHNTHLHLKSRSRTYGALLVLPYTSSWYGGWARWPTLSLRILVQYNP